MFLESKKDIRTRSTGGSTAFRCVAIADAATFARCSDEADVMCFELEGTALFWRLADGEERALTKASD